MIKDLSSLPETEKIRWVVRWYQMSRKQRKAEDMPTTAMHVAAMFGVTRDTLNRWRDDFEKLVAHDISTATIADKAKNLDDSMHEEGMEGRSKAAELWYKRQGLLVDKSKVEVEHTFGPNDYYEVFQRLKDICDGCLHIPDGGVCPLLKRPPTLLG